MKPTDECLTGACPTPHEEKKDVIKLSEGSGGKEMQELIKELTKNLPRTTWKGTDDDSANITLNNQEFYFTTDSYVATPLFFPGGNIGKIAFCGTVNDLAVRGATPLGLSLALVIEEGLPKQELHKIIQTITQLSQETGIPIVTGDTKVMEKSSVDKLIINTSGIGTATKTIEQPLSTGDIIIVSGSIGEHAAALLSKRFELQTTIQSDSKPLHQEMQAIKNHIKKARDITRGGLAATLNELAQQNNKQFFINEEHIPLHEEVRALCELLGLDAYSLACEGRLLCITSPEQAPHVLQLLKTYNHTASIIGTVHEGTGVIAQTTYGKRILDMPTGNLVPRIC